MGRTLGGHMPTSPDSSVLPVVGGGRWCPAQLVPQEANPGSTLAIMHIHFYPQNESWVRLVHPTTPHFRIGTRVVAQKTPKGLCMTGSKG
eukprot:268807-Pyramimonas_sp.AAC.1